MYEIYSEVMLTVPLTAQGLKAGNRGLVVHVHGDGEAYEVEFLTLAGETIAVATVDADLLRQVDNSSLSGPSVDTSR